MTVINFSQHKEKSITDNDFYLADTKEFCYTVDYKFGDKTFSFEIWATSWHEAELKLEALRSSATVMGRVVHQQ